MKRLALKVTIFVLVFFAANQSLHLLVLRRILGSIRPADRILYEADLTPYSLALLGTSVLDSRYVDRAARHCGGC